MGNAPSKIFTEQYQTAITEQDHKNLTEAVNWLFESKRITKKSKYYVTRFALINLVEFVNFKKAKNNGHTIEAKPSPPKAPVKKIVVSKEPKNIVDKPTEGETNSSGTVG